MPVTPKIVNGGTDSRVKRFLEADWSSYDLRRLAWSMAMVTLDWQSGINPVLLAFGIVAHVGVAKRRQFTGGVLRGVSSRTGAVDDDVRALNG
jgi:hypothetical protein